MNYHVGNYIIQIKNAALARRKSVSSPYTKLTRAIADVLAKEHFLTNIKKEEVDGKPVLLSEIAYDKRMPRLQGVAIISKPSLRVHIKAKTKAQGAKANTGIQILSTSQGIMTGKEAKKKGIGGELLFTIW